MLLNAALGCLALLSLVLLLWQWLAAVRFPLHQKVNDESFFSAVTLLKPLKGCDTSTKNCLKSWFAQDCQGPVQILFGVASADDPVCAIVRQLCQEFPASDASLMVCGPLQGTNLKVAQLAQMEKLAKHEILVISDADVQAPPNLLSNLMAPLRQPEVGLVNSFYRLANPSTLAMHWEAVAINADFWSQVLQAQSLKPLDFALGAVMGTRRELLREIGGFEGMADCLADDYQLGNRFARRGHRIALSPIVVDCFSDPMNFRQVWKHQLRWARTIRVCQPLPYFLSILSNPTFWPWLWVAVRPGGSALILAAFCLLLRLVTALDLQRRLTRVPPRLALAWLAPVKDLLQTAIWALAFLGNTIEWRGEKMQLRRDGTLIRKAQFE
jgi:ceramide glucosyltransferase